MTVMNAVRPAADEHAHYFGKYIALVPETEAIAALEGQLDDMLPLLNGLTEAQGALRYAPGKWSIKELVGHVTDAERVFAYRAMRIARADTTPLPGFEEDDYVKAANFDPLPLRALVDCLELLRRANLAMFRSFDDAAWQRRGTANEQPFSVRALAFVIAGHGRHHMGILRERYLAAK